jgi:hypothetical protein
LIGCDTGTREISLLGRRDGPNQARVRSTTNAG